MTYTVELDPDAQADLERLDATIREQALRKLKWLSENCDAASHKALKGRYRGEFSLKSGNYRILYTYNRRTTTIKVSRIRHRLVAYKEF